MSAQYPTQSSDPSSVRNSTSSFFMLRPVKKTAKTISIIVFTVLILILGYFAKDRLFTKPGVMTVIGEGKVQAQPETARLTVSWVGQGNNPSAALANEKNLLNNLINILKTYGVNEKDIQVAYARVIPPITANANYYQAVNTMDLTLNNIEKLDKVVSTLYSNGARSVANIVLSTSNPKELEEKAISQAIKDAQERAKRTAKISKKRLGKLLSLTTETTGQAGAMISQVASERGFSMGKEEAMPGKIEIIRRVSVVYELY